MMPKENADKLLTVRIPASLFDDFKEACDHRNTTMSDKIRRFIRQFVEQSKKSDTAEMLF